MAARQKGGESIYSEADMQRIALVDSAREKIGEQLQGLPNLQELLALCQATNGVAAKKLLNLCRPIVDKAAQAAPGLPKPFLLQEVYSALQEMRQ